jgi:hypothetical protein|tara:strand:+ start:18 stop:482 length:465 start_codon:yes stop_codon:yes gene_type:complete
MPLAPSEATTACEQRRESVEIDLHPRTAEALFDMQVSPISEVDDTPYVVAAHTWLMLLLLPEFGALCYLDDIVRLAATSRMALEPAVLDQLAHIQHLISQHTIWHEDWCVERSAELDLIDFDEAEFPHMCLNCGIRPGAEWLGYDECYECYSEH